jgi:hypothetical protein
MVGSLKVKVDGSWVDLGSVGPKGDQGVQGPAGAADISVRDWNAAWGTINRGTFTWSSSTSLSGGSTITNQLDWQAYAGRRYRLVLLIRAIGSDSQGTSFSIDTKNKGVTWNSGDQPFWRIYSQWDTRIAEWIIEPSTDQTYGIQCFVGTAGFAGVAATAWANGSVYYVEDIGPITPAAVRPTVGLRPVVADGNALGVIAVGFPVQPQPVTSATTQNTLTYALGWRALVGRRYRIVFAMRALTQGQIRVYVNSNGTQTHPNINGDRWASAYGNYNNVSVSWLVDGDDGLYSTQIMCDANAAGYSFYPTEFYIEDVGPNTYPALPIPEVPPAWTALPFQNSWVNYDLGTWSWGGYRKIGDEVMLRGLVLKTGNVAANENVGLLPAGFRPPKNAIFNQQTSNNPSFVRVDVWTDGGIKISTASATGYGWLSLEAIRYSVTL